MVAFSTVSKSGLRKNRSGSAASEFALILPLLTTLLFGILEFGTVVYSYSAMQFAASRAAREMAVNVADDAAAMAEAKAMLPGWARDDVTISVTQTDAADANSNIIRVQLVAQASDLSIVSMISQVVPWTLTADASIKQELPYVD